MFCFMRNTQYGKHFMREWREFRGLSLRQLESRLESEPGGEPLVSYVSLGRIERHIQPYSQPILEAVAFALQTTPASILEVNPFKEGTVIDLLRRLPREKQAEAQSYLTFLASK